MFDRALLDHRRRSNVWVIALVVVCSAVQVFALFGDWRWLVPIRRNPALPVVVDRWEVPPVEKVVYRPPRRRYANDVVICPGPRP